MEQEKLSNQKETLDFLHLKYPLCFFSEGPVKPLKIGIFQDLVADLAGTEIVSNRLLRASLRHYTSSWRYLASIKQGHARVNLQGEEGELVEQQHADHAQEQLKESKERAAAMREKNKDKKPKSAVKKHKGYVKKTSESASEKNVNSTAPNKNHKAKARSQTNKTKQTHQQNTKKVDEPLKITAPLADTDLVIGRSALVKLGKEPMPVVITDINKDDVAVQLKSGMTVRVKQAQLFAPLAK